MAKPAWLELPEGADPALARPRPDIDQHIHAVIKPAGGTTVWTYALVDRQPPGWLTEASVQVDVRSTGKAMAFTRADMVRRAICSLPLVPWPEGVVNRVDVIDGPFWLPDQTGAPRYVARYRVVFHPARLSEEA
jgi:hypothetical protein